MNTKSVYDAFNNAKQMIAEEEARHADEIATIKSSFKSHVDYLIKKLENSVSNLLVTIHKKIVRAENKYAKSMKSIAPIQNEVENLNNKLDILKETNFEL